MLMKLNKWNSTPRREIILSQGVGVLQQQFSTVTFEYLTILHAPLFIVEEKKLADLSVLSDSFHQSNM